MDNPFFSALEGNGFDASTLAKQTKDVLMPFMHYLNNSINALESKEVSCEWKVVANNRYRLKPNQRIWRLIPVSEIEVLNDQQGWFEIVSEADGTLLDEHFTPDLDDHVIVGKGAERQRFKLDSDHYRFEQNRYEFFLPELAEVSVIQWSGYQLSIRPLSVELDHVASVHVDGQLCKVVKQDNNRLTLEGQVLAGSNLFIHGQNADFCWLSSIESSSLKKHGFQKDGNGWLVFAKDKPDLRPHKIEDISKQCLMELSPAYLQYNNVALSAEQWTHTVDKDGLILEACSKARLQDKSLITCSRFPDLNFVVEPRKVEEKWIQLFEKNGSGDDNGKSELDYFFADNQHIKILDSSQRKFDHGYRVLKSRPEERQILLAKNVSDKKSRNSVYPAAQGGECEIRVSVDTSQLKRQKEAINQLMSRPAGEHQPLIQLLQGRHKTHWQDIAPVQEKTIDWQVLTDPNFDGCNRQREFVSKALATPDFAILDGPPGTGKTTTILELIFQLVSAGKRVLLSASTHAAINNVLERVKESPKLAHHIFPLRIGNGGNAIGVEEYHFDNQIDLLRSSSGCDGLSKQLLVDSSNLVCGTTIGILKLFRDKEVVLDRGEPPFDVMIIDECSKTTFQEFLVPARFAKRWILVGDVRQLSPFTDREQIVANLDHLMLVPPRGKAQAQTLSKDVQLACLLLEELRGDPTKADSTYQQPMIVPVSTGVLKALRAELEARKKDKPLSAGLDNILLIQQTIQRQVSIAWVKDTGSIKQEPWHLYATNLCFVEELALAEIQPLIPDDMLVLHASWHRSQHALQHKLIGTSVKAFKINKKDYTDTTAIQKELLAHIGETKWSEQICWRLEREYWLRLSKDYDKKTAYLTDTLRRLFPKSEQADGRIHVLKNIAFPSILEALSGDGLAKRKNDVATTLNEGFNHDEKQQRHTTLTYQHRMHPDISAFPCQQFYPKGVLADGSKTASDRAWNYKRYTSRNTWLDVAGNTQRNNSNEKEVQALILELKAFCDWAESKKKNAKGDEYDVAILTFYKGQEKALRDALQKLPGNNGRYARFQYKGISIKLATVDYFQGQEADVVFLSMVNTHRDGFMDSPNRLNVSITRARYQLVVVGHYEYFSKDSRTDELRNLAESSQLHSSVKSNEKSGRHSKKSAFNGIQ
jgi:hypothetical protein